MTVSYRLLMEHLSPKEQRRLQERRYFVVRSQFKHLYLVSTVFTSHNVFRIEPEHRHRNGVVDPPRFIAAHCVVLTQYVPLWDTFMMQKVLLECDEALFLHRSYPLAGRAIANRWLGYHGEELTRATYS